MEKAFTSFFFFLIHFLSCCRWILKAGGMGVAGWVVLSVSVVGSVTAVIDWNKDAVRGECWNCGALGALASALAAAFACSTELKLAALSRIGNIMIYIKKQRRVAIAYHYFYNHFFIFIAFPPTHDLGDPGDCDLHALARSLCTALCGLVIAVMMLVSGNPSTHLFFP